MKNLFYYFKRQIMAPIISHHYIKILCIRNKFNKFTNSHTSFSGSHFTNMFSSFNSLPSHNRETHKRTFLLPFHILRYACKQIQYA